MAARRRVLRIARTCVPLRSACQRAAGEPTFAHARRAFFASEACCE